MDQNVTASSMNDGKKLGNFVFLPLAFSTMHFPFLPLLHLFVMRKKDNKSSSSKKEIDSSRSIVQNEPREKDTGVI